jgi:hypothetical protein
LYCLSGQGLLDTDTLAVRRVAAPEAAGLIDWMLPRVARREGRRGDWRIARPRLDDIDVRRTWRGLLRDHPEYLPITRDAARVDLVLAQIFDGRRTLQEAFPTNSDAVTLCRHAMIQMTGPGLAATLRERLGQAWMDFTFGARAGWWLDGPDGTRISPQRAAAHWQVQLIRHGFICCEAPLEYAPGAMRGAYLLMATLPGSETASA